ncbi:MAG: sugar phosphate nucleotidyltransferase, partial [Bdellovibrionota bacterium]
MARRLGADTRPSRKFISKVRKAVIPAAGLGTRFLPATKAVPKEMLPILDVPMIQHIVEEAVRSGIEEIILITARHKEAIENHFDFNYELEDTLDKKDKKELAALSRSLAKMCNIISVRQKQPLGLGHAVLCAESVIGQEPFAVLLGDD